MFIVLFSMVLWDGPTGVCANLDDLSNVEREYYQLVLDRDAELNHEYEIQLNELCEEM